MYQNGVMLRYHDTFSIVVALVPGVFVTYKNTFRRSDRYSAVYELLADDVDWFSYDDVRLPEVV